MKFNKLNKYIPCILLHQYLESEQFFNHNSFGKN